MTIAGGRIEAAERENGRVEQQLLREHARARAATAGATGLDALLAALLTLAVFTLYVLTLAPTVLRSDSGETHVMPWVLGIAHAPGYPLLTIVGRLAMYLPIGDPAYRINLLDALAAAAAVGLVYLTVVELVLGKLGVSKRPASSNPQLPTPNSQPPTRVSALAAAAALGLGATYWQQSLVGGPRPFVFFFTALLLWLAIRWDNRRSAASLALLAGAAGLSIAHHPNLAMLFPGLALYLLARDPRLPLRLKQVGLGLLAFGLPLLFYLYLPIRSAMEPPLGSADLADLRQFLLYVTARNYQSDMLSNCGGSRLLQAQRYLVFLLLQFGPALALASALGALLTLIRAPLAGLLLAYAFVSNSVFGICSTLAMPDYVIPSFVVAAIWIGLGPAWLLGWLARASHPVLRTVPATLLAGLVVGLAAYRLATGLPYQDMRGRTADAEYAQAAMSQAQSNGLILSDWESVTPIWYAQHVLGLNRSTRTALVTAVPSSDTWLVEVQSGLERRPVSLAQWVPALGDKYRLFPVGTLFDVPERTVTERGQFGLLSTDSAIRLLGYRLDRPSARPGELVRLTLYQKTDRGKDDPYWPVLRLAGNPPVEYHLNGAQRYALPDWSDNEVIGEVYEFSIPAWAPPGPLPLELAYRVPGREALVALRGGSPWTPIGSIEVQPPAPPSLPTPPGTVVNFANQLVLQGGRLKAETEVDLTAAPVGARLRPGGLLELETYWSGLRWMDDSYTLFVHLLDSQHQLVAQRDSLPLGGIYHTYKWVPGQVITDWYRLPLAADLPPGDYWIEFGAYHSVTTRRLPIVEGAGGSEHTSYLWGPVRIE